MKKSLIEKILETKETEEIRNILFTETQKLEEDSVVKFDGKTYPDSGYAIIEVGGPGSGKSFAQNIYLPIQVKHFDTDKFKKLYMDLQKVGKIKDDTKYNLNNPDDVEKLHQLIKKLGYRDREQKEFFTGVLETGRLSNVLFEIIGDDINKIANIGKMCQDMGYKTVLVYIVTNRERAIIQNLTRGRIVDQKYFHELHNEVLPKLKEFFSSGNLARYIDSAWVVFNSADSGRKEDYKTEVYPNRGSRVVELKKTGSTFELPKDLEDKIKDTLGPNEPNPESPEKYKDFKEVTKDFQKNKEKYDSGETRILK